MILVSVIIIVLVWIAAIAFAIEYGRIARVVTRTSVPRTYASKSVADGVPDELRLPPLSVVIIAHDQADALRRHLPDILSQEYDDFEVIVVDMASKDETKDLLENLELLYPRLHHTYTPASARDISLERLALTLGIRSARYEWVVLTRPDCSPTSSRWLWHFGQTINTPRSVPLNIVLGSARYDERGKRWQANRIGFHRLWHTIVNANHVLSGHAAVRADACNIAYRRSFFLQRGGFAADQDLRFGAEELLVNRNSTSLNTALLTSSEGGVVQEALSAMRVWRQRRVYYMEIRRHQRHVLLFRLHQVLRLLFPWLVALLMVLPATVAVAWLVFFNSDVCQQWNEEVCSWVADDTYGMFAPTTDVLYLYIIGFVAGMVLLLLTYLMIKQVNFNRTAHVLGYKSFYLTFLLYEMQLPFWNLRSCIAHHFTSRNDFRKKFV